MNRIKDLRKKNDLTLLQLAEQLGVSESTVQRYESGNIKNLKYETIVDLSVIFDCSPAYVMGWEDSNSDQELDSLDREFNEVYRRLPEDVKRNALDYMKILEKQFGTGE